MAIARRTVDRHAAIHQALAGRVDIVDAVGEMTEVATTVVLLRIPVVGDLDHGCLALAGHLDVVGRGKEDQGEAPLLAVVTTDLHEPELVAVEVERLVEIAGADHRVQVSHGGFSGR